MTMLVILKRLFDFTNEQSMSAVLFPALHPARVPPTDVPYDVPYDVS